MAEPKSEPVHYLRNAELLPEVIKCKAEGKVSNKLAGMILLLARNYARRPNFSGYTYIDDMIAEAAADLCKNALKFKPEVTSNPFAFYTRCIHNSFIGYLINEKKHRKIRDAMLVEIGENPSYNFQDEYKNSLEDRNSDVRDEMHELSAEIAEAKLRREIDIQDELKAKAAAKAAETSSIISF